MRRYGRVRGGSREETPTALAATHGTPNSGSYGANHRDDASTPSPEEASEDGSGSGVACSSGEVMPVGGGVGSTRTVSPPAVAALPSLAQRTGAPLSAPPCHADGAVPKATVLSAPLPPGPTTGGSGFVAPAALAGPPPFSMVCPSWLSGHVFNPCTLALLGYLTCSVILTWFNKWFFSPATSPYGFHFPLTVTVVHQAVISVLVWGVVAVLRGTALLDQKLGGIDRSASIVRICLIMGAACGVDWGLSNVSLRLVPLFLYELGKCCTPLIIMAITASVGLIPCSRRVAAVVVLLTAGLVMGAVAGHVTPADHHPHGGGVVASNEHGVIPHLPGGVGGRPTQSAEQRDADHLAAVSGTLILTISVIVSGVRVSISQYGLQRAARTSSSTAAAGEDDTSAQAVGGAVGSGADDGCGGGLSPTLAGGGGRPSPVSSSPFWGSQWRGGYSRVSPAPTQTTPSASPGPASSQTPTASSATAHCGTNPITALYFATPASMAVLILPALLLEGGAVTAWFRSQLADGEAGTQRVAATSVMIVLSLIPALGLHLCDLMATKRTSALTVSVASVTKQMVLAGIAIVSLGERPSPAALAGLVLAAIGVAGYAAIKR